MKKLIAAAALVLSSIAAHAGAVDTLKAFVREVKRGTAAFTQTVTSPDGAKKKTSSGTFQFERPNPLDSVHAVLAERVAAAVEDEPAEPRPKRRSLIAGVLQRAERA